MDHASTWGCWSDDSFGPVAEHAASCTPEPGLGWQPYSRQRLMKRIFLSDLHLEDVESNVFQRFSECLALECRQVDEIYVLGDLMEMWVGDDDDDDIATALRAVLASTTAICPVFILHGNRDFLLGETFSHDTGANLLPDPHCTADGVLLSHGDALCTDDSDYQSMRTLLRSSAWQTDILDKTLQERKAFGAALRAQSRQSNANKATNIMDVNTDATYTLLDAAQPARKVLIHGHTHRPGVHSMNDYTRIVTGTWSGCGWLCRQQDSQFQLECFSLARRYGT